jgi:hypothetical protein
LNALLSLGLREKRYAQLSLLALLLLALLLLAPLALLALNMMPNFLSTQLPTARPTAACRDDGHAKTCPTVRRLESAGA